MFVWGGLTNSYEKKVDVEFWRRSRRGNKAFLSEQCKEIQENNKMGNTSDLFKKIRDTKGKFI